VQHKACVWHKHALKLSDKESVVALVIAIDAWKHGDLMYKYYIINLKLSDKESVVALVIAIDAWKHGDLMYKYYIIN